MMPSDGASGCRLQSSVTVKNLHRDYFGFKIWDRTKATKSRTLKKPWLCEKVLLSRRIQGLKMIALPYKMEC